MRQDQKQQKSHVRPSSDFTTTPTPMELPLHCYSGRPNAPSDIKNNINLNIDVV